MYCKLYTTVYKYPQHVKQILIFPSRRDHPKRVTTPQRSGIKEPALWRTIRKSVAAEKGEKKMTAGGLELIDQIDGGQIRSRGERETTLGMATFPITN